MKNKPVDEDLLLERRRNGGLTDEQVEVIKKAIIASIYQDIGKSLVKKAIWAGGAVLIVVAAWLIGGKPLVIKLLEP